MNLNYDMPLFRPPSEGQFGKLVLLNSYAAVE